MLESSSTASIHTNVKRNNKENQTISGAMTIPISSLPNQNNSNNLANSVIQQTNQQSVIQSVGGSSVQILQNNRMEQTAVNSNDNNESNNAEKKAELRRRPSYRKILNELSSADTAGILESERTNENQSQSSNTSQHIVDSNSDAVLSLAQPITVNLSSQSNSTSANNTHTDQNNNDTIPFQVGPYLKMIPTTMLSSEQQNLLPATVQLSNANNQHQVNHGIVQYSSSNHQDQLFITDALNWPYRVNSADFSTYQLRDPSNSPVMLNSSNVSNASFQSSGSSSNNNNTQHRGEEEQDKKRQLRLQKNREAAKECRRKKKEYIKCLEHRVNILEAQNKTLIEELKTLKELYCQQNE